MNPRRWAAMAAIAAAVAVASVLGGVSLLSNDGRMTGQPASQLREAFGFDAAYTDPVVLVVRYGDSSSCPSLAVRHVVVQKSDRIVVTLTRTPIPTDRACTSDYGAKLVRITLTAPLGTREVIDASRNSQVPLSTGTPPFG